MSLTGNTIFIALQEYFQARFADFPKGLLARRRQSHNTKDLRNIVSFLVRFRLKPTSHFDSSELFLFLKSKEMWIDVVAVLTQKITPRSRQEQACRG